MVKIWPAIHVNDDIVSAEGTLESWCSREIRERVSEEGKRRQKAMSEALDRKFIDDECAADTTASHIRAHLKLVDQDGCGQWLVAPPCSEAGTLLDGELFRIAAKRRIRARFQTTHDSCPLCGDPLDMYMDHALVCHCGGDRTVRHNLVQRDLTRSFQLLGFRPVPEKAGLLPTATSEIEGNAGINRCLGTQNRRPADVWVPLWENGRGTAVDVALTSGMALSWIHRVARDPEGPTVVYEQHKREDRNTEAQCTAEGFMLLPFIVEAHSGSFGADAKKLLRQMGQRFASSSGGNVGSKVSELAMRIQATLHRETARAVLRRWSHRLEGLPRAFQ